MPRGRNDGREIAYRADSGLYYGFRFGFRSERSGPRAQAFTQEYIPRFRITSFPLRFDPARNGGRTPARGAWPGTELLLIRVPCSGIPPRGAPRSG